MPANYVFVDLDNVTPQSLESLAGGEFQVELFVGAHRAKGSIPFELSRSKEALGPFARYVPINRSGKNAVDMHIAFYIGRLLEKQPGVAITIVSGDKDFDPLLEHLRESGTRCSRVKSVADIPKAPRAAPRGQRTAGPRAGSASKAVASGFSNAVTTGVLKHLSSLTGKPATRRKLAQVIAQYAKHHEGPRDEKAVEQLIDELITLKYVKQSGTRVSYALGS